MFSSARLAFVLFVFIALPRFSSMAALPADAQAMLDSIPGKKLEIPFVLARAAESSDSFRAAQSGMISVDVARLQAESALAWRPFFKVNKLQDKREAGNSFSPNRIENQTLSLGVSTAFQSGTKVQAEVSHGSNLIALGIGQAFDYYETKGTLSISQSLLADAFGQSSRALQQSAVKASEAQFLTAKEALEDWALSLVGLYYGAWLAQAQSRAAIESFGRKQRLRELLEIQNRRGTAERPDLLQTENAFVATQNQKEQAALRLQDQWRDLVTALKLNTDWAQINALDIPIALDEPHKKALSLCGSEKLISSAPEGLPLKRAALLAEAAQKSDVRARGLARPDLQLQAQLFANGIDALASQSFADFGSFNRTGYALGLTFSFPIGLTAEKAEALSSTANWVRADATFQIARDMNQTQWVSRCLDLFRLNRTAESFRKNSELQHERSELEERRFKLGRGSTFQVIQAGDDATQAELALDAIEVELRTVAWRILKSADQMALPEISRK
ncbi:MAG: TolC family protein [Bdellovibrionales bacterium]|nr:TolC family protein [Bdellovibrionales bacterium]